VRAGWLVPLLLLALAAPLATLRADVYDAEAALAAGGVAYYAGQWS
jgi:hypothetical protein